MALNTNLRLERHPVDQLKLIGFDLKLVNAEIEYLTIQGQTVMPRGDQGIAPVRFF